MHLMETEGIGDLVGLLEILEDVGKPVDIAKLDDSLDEERVTFMNLLNDTEALGLVEIINGDVLVTEKGRKFLQSNMEGRKSILRKQIVLLEPFNSLVKEFESRNEKELSREDVEELINATFPSEDIYATFNLLVNWGRYLKLIDYDIDTEKVILLNK